MTSVRDFRLKVINYWKLGVRYTPNSKIAVARDDLWREARKQGIKGQVTTISHFGITCMAMENHATVFQSLPHYTWSMPQEHETELAV